MTQSWFVALTSALAISLFLGMLLLLECGRRLGLRESAKHGASARSGVGVVDGVVYSLLGLLIGFTFSGAANRFDARRLRIGDVVHAIGVAWEAIDVLPPESQPPIRAGFKEYLDALLAADTTQEPPSADKFLEASDVTKARHAVWLQAVAAVSVPSGERARLVLLPALREMFVSAERERIARLIHPPKIIYVMLGLTRSRPPCSEATRSRPRRPAIGPTWWASPPPSRSPPTSSSTSSTRGSDSFVWIRSTKF